MARTVSSRLASAGLDVWWDADKMEGGTEFTAEIVEAIIRQYYFLFLLSHYAVESRWCRRELARAIELGKTIIPLLLEDVPPEQIPLELSGLQHVDLRRGLDDAMPALNRAVGLGLAPTYQPSDDPFARDGRLIHVIAEQIVYGKTFTDTLNLVHLLSRIGVKCSSTERAQKLFIDMASMKNYGGSKIDYDKVAEFLLRGWDD
jgi:hypothetical protein